ncbi:NUDIX hydrolase [Natrinema pellirubrum DSM 15624]|uniref:Oxidized purine nucleoside triphosphate hydrolase n=1 Tax=Natrinema pellirubrum (strain DSM 15624 / CIP 106293 / JCM 10476 / NCIMB 786 / 157) TaxID=797303 RepID=L0JFU9_NATP1|nr:8-oxo-dGTP diphosphatase [Natrinema pellirubrum]AGB30395.1 ADP-ribose pyrophosphatase [Natrinema pellirubrum DSM 15624]ELY79378.1 NUDIX hydrolase [Natrinema pellirubrum DSM 15624]
MIEATLCFPLREGGDADEEVLLIEKRRGLGEGWYNGPGGKCEPGETPRECAVRETEEEVGLEVTDLEKAGELTFLLDGEAHTFCHVYRSRSFEGEPTSSEEAYPEWVPVDDVPYDRMWDDDHLWLPGVLEGNTVAGEFRFEGGEPLDEAAFVDHDLEWGVSLESRE